MSEENQQGNQFNNQNQPKANPPKNTSGGGKNDVEENKIFAIIGYLGILFLVPLLAKKESPFAQFHAKQGMVLCITSFVAMFVIWIPFIGWAIWLFLLIMMIMGIINASGGKMKELPLIGGIAKKINL
jgi:uncharacterized membrane protein